MSAIDLRCPSNPARLFLRVLHEKPLPVVEGNLLEVACHDCGRQQRKEDPTVWRVLHRFDVTGVLVQTEVLRTVTPGEVVPITTVRSGRTGG